MQPFRTHKGKVVPLDRANVDTDQIIPKQFLSESSAPASASSFFMTGAAARMVRRTPLSP